MKVLVFFDTEIKAWLVGEDIENTEAHIRNGYPELLEGFQSGTIKVENIDVPSEDIFKAELYSIVEGRIKRKQNGGQ